MPAPSPQTDSTSPSDAFHADTTARHGLYALVDQGLVSLASFVGTVLVGRVSREELGIYALGITMFWLIAGIPNALVWTPYTSRASHLTTARRRRFAAASGLLSSALAITMFLAAVVAGAGALAFDGGGWLGPFLLAMGPLALTMTVREHLRRVYIADFAGPRLLLLDVPICVAVVALQALLFRLGKLDAAWGLLATAVSAVPALWVLSRQLRIGRGSFSRARLTLRTNWHYGRWLLLVAVAWLASDALLRTTLVAVHGPGALGSLAGAFAIVALVNPLLLAMTAFARSVASRRLSETDQQQLVSGALRSTRWAAMAGTLAFMLLAWLGPLVTEIALGQGYDDRSLLVLLAAAVCIEGIAVPLEAALVALERGPQLARAAIARLLLSVTVGAALVVPLAATGIAVAMLSRSVLVVLMYIVMLSKRQRATQAPAVATPQLQRQPRPTSSKRSDREPVTVESGS